MDDARRLSIRVTGVVQGVGFRPFVYGLATRAGLAGSVWNEASDVVIEVEGPRAELDALVVALRTAAPPLARVESVTVAAIAIAGERGFRIVASRGASGRDVALSPDVATCDDCLREIRDPSDRRYRYAFTNFTNCGPRLTIIAGAPYDRERTTMASFVMCDRCRAEYDDPRDRRFHAQPVACPACGPRLALRGRAGEEIACEDPIAETARRLLGGGIAAINGLGGYHLACDARSEAAVAELRRRKHRDEKPFAVMVVDMAAAARLCDATHLRTLDEAIEHGFAAPLPAFVRAELAGFVDCGIMARGFALIACPACPRRIAVGFSCKARSVCPSCVGRRMASTSADLIDHILPERAPLRPGTPGRTGRVRPGGSRPTTPLPCAHGRGLAHRDAASRRFRSSLANSIPST